MSDERDLLVSQRYRELGAEEPRPELDRAIIGAARRATSRARWYPSLAAAAVLVFAVAIAFHIEREPPPSEPVATAPEPEQRAAEAPMPPQEAPPARQAPQPRAERKVSPAAQPQAAPRFTPEPPPSAPAPAPAPEASAPSAVAADMAQSRPLDERYAAEAARSAAEREARGANLAAPSARTDARTQRLRAQAPSPAAAQVTSETPQQWLERIARLREQGNDAAADRELASFRSRYPDYLIPEALAKRVEKQTPAAAPQK